MPEAQPEVMPEALPEVIQEVLPVVIAENVPEDVEAFDFSVDSIFEDIENIELEIVDWNLYGARPRTRPRPVCPSPARTRHRVREEAGPASRTRSQSSM